MIRQFKLGGLEQFLDSPRNIAITTHHKPDGDAMGSSLGLYHYLIKKGHSVQVVTPNDFPEFLSWMPATEKVIEFEKDPAAAAKAFEKADLLFCLDFNTSRRVEKMEELLLSFKGQKVLIDHHLSPDMNCEYIFSFPEAGSTSELIYDFIFSLNDVDSITKETAECLYTGIMTDTGSFRFSSMTSESHRKIAFLMDKGAENYKIHEAVYDTSSEARTRMLGYCLSEKLKVLPEFGTAYIYLTRDELNRFNHQTGDTEGIVNYALGIKGIKMAAFFAERKNEIKISFRSKDDFSVKEFAEKHFSGGGHKNAAGGKSDMSMNETLAKFENLLPTYKKDLIS